MAEGEVTISELELADEVLGDMVLAVDTTSDTKSVSLRQLKAWLGSSLPTGFIIPAVGRISDERFTLLDGKTLARDGTYQAFCNKVVEQVQAGNWFACTAEEYEADLTNHGQCGRFVITNDYVRIPTITKFMGATITLSQIGQAEGAGLPNITGEIIHGFMFTNSGGSDTPTSSGAIAVKNIDNIGIYQGTTTKRTQWDFDASRVSSIYGNSDTVTPENIKYPYYMVVSTEGQTSPVEININQVYEDMNLKADQAYVDARTPTGTILTYGGSTAPSGFLLCNGGAISRTTYASLFAVIGTTYGAGNGSTTFNLPNGKMPLGNSAQARVHGNGKSLGLTDGAKITGLVSGSANNTSKITGSTGMYNKNYGYSGSYGDAFALTPNKAIGVVTSGESGLKSTVDLTTASAVSNAIIKY